MEETRVCRVCGVEKIIKKFRKYRNRDISARRKSCRSCEYDKEKQVPGFKDRAKFYKIKASYGLSKEDYNLMIVAQGGLCALCGRTPTESGFSVDHDHSCCDSPRSCGKCVRSLLCRPCNSLLGILENNGMLEKVIRYIGETS